METHLYLPAALQRAFYVLLLWALILQMTIIQSGDALTEIIQAAPRNVIANNQKSQPPLPARICKSIEVRTMNDLQLLRNCKLVLGYVRISYLPSTITGNETPDISTAVEEITDYLLVYRSHGLKTLAQIFPRLEIIRGSELLFDEFALAIYENRELRNLGLGSLLRIQAGNIRIESNPSLCYVETVNWVQLLGNSTQQHFYHKNNKINNHCALCPRTGNELVAEEELPENLRSHCWSIYLVQRRPATSSLVNCSSNCGIRGCDDNGKCCDHNCLSGCNGMHCDLCANLNLDGQCLDTCPQNYFLYQKRECINSKKCRQLGGIPHAASCVEKCPKYYISSFNRMGDIYCNLLCTGNFIIHNADDIESLKGCITINGSLTIELTDIKVKITNLENAFKNVTEITGYLRVINSPQLVTLYFLPNLISIRGQQLIDDSYALYVVNNYHLAELWTPNQKVAIGNGSIYFHLNPRLCLDKIFALNDSLKEATPLNNINISPHSNGERVICNSYLDELNTTVEDFNSTAALIKIDIFTNNNIQIILGYVYFFKATETQNVTLFEGRHGCGHDHWHMSVNPTKNIRFILTNLKPYTQYAYFVKTLTVTDYHIKADAYSKIQYFHTLPRKPGPLRKVYYTPIAFDTIILHWWPPRKANGIIEKYLIKYEKVNMDKPNVTLSDHPGTPKNAMECDCEEIDPEDSGPLPSDENFYSREQMIYEELLPNLMFAKVGDTRRVHRDLSAIDFDPNSNCTGKVATTPNTLKVFLETTVQHIRKRRKISESEGKPTETEDKAKATKKKIENKEDDDHNLEGDPNFRAAIRNYNRIIKQQEEAAIKAQDTGPDDFPILKPRRVCPLADVSIQYQLQNNCEALEMYEGIEVPGHIHSHRLTGLEPNQMYRISVRACVAHLKNGCGPETSIFAETLNKSMQEYILNSPNTY